MALSSAGAVMGWFTKFCRNAGLMVHNLKQSGRDDTQKKEVSRQTEETKLDEKTTLRRTTIDEVEVRREKGHDG